MPDLLASTPLPLPLPPALLPAVRLAVLAGPVAGAAAVLAWRVREARRPLTVGRIVAPPLGMATGLVMFLLPACRLPWAWAAGALLLGAGLLAWPMVRASALERDARGAIVLRRSRALLGVFAALVAVRLAARPWVAGLATPAQTAALFYLLALGMIARWRLTVLARYRRLRRADAAAPGVVA